MSREELVYGVHATLALFAHRPEAILRVYHVRARREVVAPLLKWCAAHRLPYREVPDEELARITKADHSEGVAVAARPLGTVPLESLLSPPDPRAVLLALDNVGNPHNLGAILRSAASLGARGVVARGSEAQARLSPAAVRIAQGAAETVRVAVVPSLPQALRAARTAGFTAIGTDSTAGAGLFDAVLPRPAIVVLGSEGDGLTPEVRKACDRLVRIPSTGLVQSLNVSVAAGIVLAELWRTRG